MSVASIRSTRISTVDCGFFLPAALGFLLMVPPGCEDPVRQEQNGPGAPTSADAVVQSLAYSYQHQDFKALRSLLADDKARNAEYVFYLPEPTQFGETQWGHAEEVRLHRRMFDPQDTLEDEPAVPARLWLQSVEIHLTRLEPFEERKDLYSEDHGVDGKLDPDIWNAVDARYGTDVFFDTQSDTDFQVSGEANFVVIEDKTKRAGDSGKFLLYIWEDLGSAPPKPGDGGASAVTWTRMKSLYL